MEAPAAEGFFSGLLTYASKMTSVRIGYARCSTDRQDLTAQRAALEGLGVEPDRIYTDHGFRARLRRGFPG